MIEIGDMTARSAALRGQLHAKLGVRADTLETAFTKAGRQLPRRVRANGRALVRAEKLAGHPKLARQLDGVAVLHAFDEVAAHLRGIDVADRRRGRLLSLVGGVAGNLLVVLVAFILWLWWRGYI